jgi:hypothetical protein
MKAAVGDRIVMAGEQVDRPTRDGEVLEVRGKDGSPPFLVRWSDGHSGLIYPGPGSVLRLDTAEGPTADQAESPGQAGEAADSATVAHQWTVRISVFEGDDTTARAVLVADPLDEVRGTGSSHRRAGDPAQSRIGDEVAVARALRHLADELLERASVDIADSTGESDVRVSPT